jgi:hypothetical protein
MSKRIALRRAEKGEAETGRGSKVHALADAQDRPSTTVLTGGEAHDCPIVERFIRRGKRRNV